MGYAIGDRIEVEVRPPRGIKYRCRGLMPDGQAMYWHADRRTTCEIADEVDAKSDPRKITPAILSELERERLYFIIYRSGESPDALAMKQREHLAALEAQARQHAEERERLEERAKRSEAAAAAAEEARAEAARLREELAAARALVEGKKGK